MRLLFPLAALLIAVFSLTIGFFPIPYNSSLCVNGLCRFDQMTASIDQQGLNTESILTILDQNPGNPLLWSTYGDLLAMQGKTKEAAIAHDRAVELGPYMATVLMRNANFDFTHDRRDHGRLLAKQILAKTEVFDQILFSYFTAFRFPISQILDTAVPAEERAARSWLMWLQSNGSDQDLLATWNWIILNQLADEKTTIAFMQTLWNRHSFAVAQQVWMGWLGDRTGKYLNPERVWNPHFEYAPSGSPLDWVISAPPSVKIDRKNGLEIRFSGMENIAFSHIHQFVTVRPGTYRFRAEIEADGLTTDQHPLFHVFDPLRPNVLNVQTEPIQDTRRTMLSLDFNVPTGTVALQIQLERRPSERFDNKVAGILKIYSISLIPLLIKP